MKKSHITAKTNRIDRRAIEIQGNITSTEQKSTIPKSTLSNDDSRINFQSLA